MQFTTVWTWACVMMVSPLRTEIGARAADTVATTCKSWARGGNLASPQSRARILARGDKYPKGTSRMLFFLIRTHRDLLASRAQLLPVLNSGEHERILLPQMASTQQDAAATAALAAASAIPAGSGSAPAAAAVPVGAPMTSPVATVATGEVSTSSPAPAAPAATAPTFPLPSLVATSSEAAAESAADDDDDAEEEEEAGDLGSRYWLPSVMTSAYLKELEEGGYIPPKTECFWRVPGDEAVPDPQDGERVMLASHSLRGMSLPLSAFFLAVLSFYGLQPHNIAPNSILVLAGFQALCEGYLGIAASIELFKYCFLCRRQTIPGGHLATCGSVTFNCRQPDWYPKIPYI